MSKPMTENQLIDLKGKLFVLLHKLDNTIEKSPADMAGIDNVMRARDEIASLYDDVNKDLAVFGR